MPVATQPPKQSDTALPPPPPRRRRRGLGFALWSLAAVVVLAGLVSVAAYATRDIAVVEDAFDVSTLTSLDIAGVAGDVDIVVEDRADVLVTSRLSSSLWNDASAGASLDDGTLTLDSGCERQWLTVYCTADQTVAVPADALSHIDITTTAGDVMVTGFDGEVSLLTRAGDVVLRDFGGETAVMETTAGNVVIEAGSALRSLEARTTAGDVDVTVADETYLVTTDTSVGDVDVAVRQAPDADRRITVRTSAGDISIRRR